MADDGLSQLTDDEKTGFLALLKRATNDDRYPLSPRIRTLRNILTKLQPPQPAPAALPPLRHYAPPRATARHRKAAAGEKLATDAAVDFGLGKPASRCSITPDAKARQSSPFAGFFVRGINTWQLSSCNQ
jgi:hypothetical protein